MPRPRATDEPGPAPPDPAAEPTVVLAGAGAMGRALAVLLCAGGTRTSLFAREPAADALVANRHLELGGVSELSVPTAAAPGRPGILGVVSDARSLPDDAHVIFATKGPQLRQCVDEVCTGLDRAGRGVAGVSGLQNGVVKDDVLAEAFGRASVVRMVSTLNARVDSVRRVVVSGWGHTYVGDTGSGDAAARLAAALGRARVPTTLLPSGSSEVITWMKCVNAIGVFGITALSRLPTNVAFAQPHLVRAYLSLAGEAAAVARSHGVEPADFAGLPMRARLSGDAEAVTAEIVAETQRASAVSVSYSSMAQDIIAGRPTEVEEIFGDLVRRAADAGVPVPAMTTVYRLIAGQAGQGAVGASDSPPSNTTADPVMNEHSGDTR